MCLYADASEWEPEGTGECGARVWCPDLLHEGQWHHIAIVLNRAVLKNSSFSLYLDGQHIHSQKVIIDCCNSFEAKKFSFQASRAIYNIYIYISVF